MVAVTDADRKAAEELRAVLADQSGFWHRPGDDSALCLALAHHREQCELQLLEKMSQSGVRAPAIELPAGVPLGRAIKRPRAAALSR